MKKILSLVLCMVLFAISFPCRAFAAEDYLKKDGLEYRIHDDHAMVTDFYYTETAKSITIPSEVQGVPVTVIATAFYEENILEEIIISENVTDIGADAFAGCDNLKSISFPASLERIYSSAFYGNHYYFKKLYISDIAALCNLEVIEDPWYDYGIDLYQISELYLNGERIHSIVIPEGTTAIRNEIVCDLLNNSTDALVVPASVKYLEENSLLTDKEKPIFYLGSEEEWAEIEGSSTASFGEYRNNIIKDVTMDEDGWLYKKTEDGTRVEIYNYCGSEKEVTFPREIEGLPTFMNRSSLSGICGVETVNFNGTPEEFASIIQGDFNEFSANHNIVYNIVPIEGIILAGGEESITLDVGETFVANYEIYPENANGIVTFSTNNSCVSINGNVIKGESAGEATVTMTAESGVKYSFEVKVIGCIGIEVARLPDKVNYSTRQPFDITGIVINKLYNDGTAVETKSFTCSGYNALKKGVQTITVTAGSYTTRFEIYSSDAVVGDIDLDGSITGMDSNYMKRTVSGNISVEEKTEEFFVCDLNGDGEINAIDSALLRRKIAG